jgi:hypothetical protein
LPFEHPHKLGRLLKETVGPTADSPVSPDPASFADAGLGAFFRFFRSRLRTNEDPKTNHNKEDMHSLK